MSVDGVNRRLRAIDRTLPRSDSKADEFRRLLPWTSPDERAFLTEFIVRLLSNLPPSDPVSRKFRRDADGLAFAGFEYARS